MNKYDFALTFKLAEEIDSEIYLDALYEAECDDASVCMGKIGWLELDFIRSSPSASEAIETAIISVNHAIPDAVLKHISPDIVGIAEIATIMNCSRQYVRQMINSNSYTFPNPIYNQSKSLWHLIEVLRWFKDQKRDIDNLDIIFETTKFARIYNNTINSKNIDVDINVKSVIDNLVHT